MVKLPPNHLIHFPGSGHPFSFPLATRIRSLCHRPAHVQLSPRFPSLNMSYLFTPIVPPYAGWPGAPVSYGVSASGMHDPAGDSDGRISNEIQVTVKAERYFDTFVPICSEPGDLVDELRLRGIIIQFYPHLSMAVNGMPYIHTINGNRPRRYGPPGQAYVPIINH
jgi:hypothetical protein